MAIEQCIQCGLGVVAQEPESTAHFYGGSYYSAGEATGYNDYGFMAEHGLGWAAALVKLLRSEGRILDVGCADGYLLQKFGAGFEKFGIEVNPRAAQQAASSGVRMLGNDLLDPSFIESYRSTFDIVTAIAVFEHLLDFRRGFSIAVDALKPDGILLFEVPVISPTGSNEAWMQGSFEHIYYPSENAIRHIVETVLGCKLVGAELAIRGYASTFIGLVSKDGVQSARMRELFERVMHFDLDRLSAPEREAATHLRLMHAAHASEATVLAIADLPEQEMTRPLLARIGQLWSFDSKRLRAQDEQLAQLKSSAHNAQLAADYAIEALAFETKRAAVMAGKFNALQAQLAVAAAPLGLGEQRAMWRATALRKVAARFPKLAMRSRQAAKLVLWTLRGTLSAHLREIRHRRATHMSLQTPRGMPDHGVELLPRQCVVPVEADISSDQQWPLGRPLVSVVIPCFNYGHLVEDAIRSVDQQTFTDLEIIVVEGGSNSVESRLKLAEAVRNAASPRLRVLWQETPHRAGANRNLGISHARGKYICCLDADDRIAPTYIEKAVFLLEAGFDVVSPALQFFGNKVEVWAPHEQPTLDMLLDGNQVLTCALFRKVLWREADGYRDSDPATGHLHEDWLFWVRLAALGARFINLREPLFHYRSHEGTLSNSASVLQHHAQSSGIRRFNADVLTPEAIARARRSLGSAPRAPQSYRASARGRSLALDRDPTLLLAMPYLVLGGAERLLSAVVGHLVKCGWRVIVVTTVPIEPSHGDTTSWFESATVEIFHLPRFLDVEYWKDFVDQLVASRAIDLVWVAGSALVYDCLPALRLRNAALRVADLLFNTQGHTRNNRRYADCIDLTFVENTEVRSWLLEAGEIPDRVCMVESGVDLVENAPASLGDDVRAECGLPSDSVVIGFFGHWSDEKDPLGFVEIAKRVPREANVTFVMTGAGPLESELKQAIAAARFPSGRFLLKGAVSDLKPYLRASDLLVLPSRLDGRPNVVMEALASGVAVLASRVGALPEMFEDSRQGYLCAAGDYDCFAARITELASDRERLGGFKQEARRHAQRRLDIRAMLGTYEERLRRLVRDR
ncbi:MAG: glycosyltransferase [Variovorax sp.]